MTIRSNFIFYILLHSAQLSNLTVAIKMGELAVNLCFQTQSMMHLVEFVPTFSMILLTSKRFQDAAALLTKFYSYANYSKDFISLTWYFALAMDFLLDTGTVIETFEVCKNFCDREVVTKGNANDEGQLRLAANLLTFHSRIEMRAMQGNDELREIEEIVQSKNIGSNKFHSLDQIFTFLRLYELNYLRHQSEIVKLAENFPDFIKVQFKWLQIVHEAERFKKFNFPSRKSLEKLRLEAIKYQNYLCHDELQIYQLLFKEYAV